MHGISDSDKLHTISDYYSASQLRADRWSALRETAESLDRQGGDENRDQARRLLQALAPIEMYFAFPGGSAFDYLRRLLDHGNFGDFSTAVRRVSRALTSGAFRRRSIPLIGDEADSRATNAEARTGR